MRERTAAHGRDPDELTLSLRVYLDPAGVMKPEHSLAGSPEVMRERIAEFERIGVSHVLLDPVARGGVSGRLEAVCRFMEDVAKLV